MPDTAADQKRVSFGALRCRGDGFLNQTRLTAAHPQASPRIPPPPRAWGGPHTFLPPEASERGFRSCTGVGPPQGWRLSQRGCPEGAQCPGMGGGGWRLETGSWLKSSSCGLQGFWGHSLSIDIGDLVSWVIPGQECVAFIRGRHLKSWKTRRCHSLGVVRLSSASKPGAQRSHS